MLRFLVLGVALLASSASAQVIYEPVQYQFGEAKKYYYGGSDSRFARFLARQASRPMYDRPTDYGLNGSRVDAFGEPVTCVPRVYSDWYPYENANVYGYTPTDAYNEANANVPLYFTKRDAVLAATRMDCIAPQRVLTTRPAAMKKGTILIIPRRVPEPRPKASDKVLSAAR